MLMSLGQAEVIRGSRYGNGGPAVERCQSVGTVLIVADLGIVHWQLGVHTVFDSFDTVQLL
jgi:hypothetical protein